MFSVILIVVGLFRPQDSIFALFGFLFLFLLGLIILNTNLQYESGSNINSSYIYEADGTVNKTIQTINYTYDSYSDSTTHQIAYWILITSIVGFFGVIFSLRSKPGENQ